MYNLLYRLFFFLNRKKKVLNRKFPLYMQRCIDYIEWYYNIVETKMYTKFPFTKNGVAIKKEQPRIIVSLTSYPKRINTVWITIETLMRQTVKPDKIILWLAEEQFQGMESLPEELLRLRQRGLTIRFCDDLRSHKKYYYVMQEYPEDFVILVDDDMFYPKDTIKKLMKMHERFPKDICCMTGQVMEHKGKEDLPSSWRNPYVKEKLEHRDDVQIFTGSGSLYPPGCLHKDVFDRDLIKTLCPYADDLWLTYMAHKKGIKVTTFSPWRAFPVTIYGTSENSLWYINAEQGQNDKQWKVIKEYYKDEGKENDK